MTPDWKAISLWVWVAAAFAAYLVQYGALVRPLARLLGLT
jgi:hypothetical protein